MRGIFNSNFFATATHRLSSVYGFIKQDKMRRAFLVITTGIISNITFGQKTQNEKLDSLFASLENKKMFNGNVLIAEKGKIIFQKSYGLANEETGRKLNNQTIFELASVSKQFTAMGIVLLEKRGKLKYDDDIAKYIPELGFYGNISIKNLLHHTGGLPDYIELFNKKWDKTKFATNQDIVNELSKHKPEALFQPGEKWEYSNTGYALLGLIIEKVSGKSFGKFLSENIFRPLNMKNSFVYRSRFEPRKIENYALGYAEDSTGNKVLTESFGKAFYTYYLDGIVGDGMVNATTEDLLKWDRALYSEKLINAKDKEIIFSAGKTNDGKDTDYGFGWFTGNLKKYGRVVNHSGSWPGYVSFIERHLDNDKTIIFLQNNSTFLTHIPSTEVRKILYNQPLLSGGLKPVTLSADELEKYTGTYTNEEIPLSIKIFTKENILMAQAEGDETAFPLDAYEKHTFKFEPAQIKIVVSIEEKAMDFFQGGSSFRFKKKE